MSETTEENNTVPTNQPVEEASTPSNREKMQAMFNEQLQPLKDEITRLQNENNTFKKTIEQKDNEITDYQKNMFHTMATNRPTESPNMLFAKEYARQIEAGLEMAWRKSGFANRPELKAKWMETAQNEILKCIG